MCYLFKASWEFEFLYKLDMYLAQKDYFGLKCILSYYVPVQTIVSPYDAHWFIHLQILISFLG